MEPTTSSSNRNMIIGIVVVIVILIIAYLAYANMQPATEVMNTTNNTVTTNTESTDMTDHSGMDMTSSSTAAVTASTSVSVGTGSTVKSFTVNGSNYKFAPTTMTVKKGDTVKITFVSSGSIHDLVVDGYNVRTKELSPGQSQTIQFVANKSGTFEYYCSVGSHRAMGMKGTLTVQ